ncbi:hypothetical protein THERMOT_1142 [Bathymodiolus thermophilus thioautotrophic gill symbiont]|nr:hypothetical protein THERMOT_1142 [Bathymodiolus thermophilus thioautotrophic gill symbiont]
MPIQPLHPYNTQDYNRYSYATNNPLKYVDMNGFGWFSKARRNIAKFYKKYGRQIASIDILFIPGVNIYVAGFLSGMIDLKQRALVHLQQDLMLVYCIQ